MVSKSFMVLLSSHKPPTFSFFFHPPSLVSDLDRSLPRDAQHDREYGDTAFTHFTWHKKLDIDGLPPRTISDCLVL